MHDMPYMRCAGQGDCVHCWKLGKGASSKAASCRRLPPASFGGVSYPDIEHLQSAGQDCIIGCSSIGSVALWNYARWVLCQGQHMRAPLCNRTHALWFGLDLTSLLLHELQPLPSGGMPELAGYLHQSASWRRWLFVPA